MLGCHRLALSELAPLFPRASVSLSKEEGGSHPSLTFQVLGSERNTLLVSSVNIIHKHTLNVKFFFVALTSVVMLHTFGVFLVIVSCVTWSGP